MEPVIHKGLAGEPARPGRRWWCWRAAAYRHLCTLLVAASCGLLGLIPIALGLSEVFSRRFKSHDEIIGTAAFLLVFLPVAGLQGIWHSWRRIYVFLVVAAMVLMIGSTVALGWGSYNAAHHVPKGPFDGLGYTLLAIAGACGGGISIALAIAAGLGARARNMRAILRNDERTRTGTMQDRETP